VDSNLEVWYLYEYVVEVSYTKNEFSQCMAGLGVGAGVRSHRQSHRHSHLGWTLAELCGARRAEHCEKPSPVH